MNKETCEDCMSSCLIIHKGKFAGYRKCNKCGKIKPGQTQWEKDLRARSEK